MLEVEAQLYALGALRMEELVKAYMGNVVKKVPSQSTLEPEEVEHVIVELQRLVEAYRELLTSSLRRVKGKA
ncbi:MAG: hypothetical protein DRO13_02825 [Thermoprotei archaeon]|nr:MAG: hypothetical protein DRO13_02825 [Thermoprotei archaeon]